MSSQKERLRLEAGWKERDAIIRIHYLSERNPKEARAEYKEAFRVSHDDPSIDEKIAQIARDQMRLNRMDSSNTIKLPAQLVLALMLRPRGHGRGRKRPPKPRQAVHEEPLAIWWASKRWAELGGDKEARHKAATEALARYKYAGLGLGSLKRKMRLSEGRELLKS
jgi:hypothetical protein